MQDIILTSNTLTPSERPYFVTQELTRLKGAIESNFFLMCELLTEAHSNGYHTIFGYSEFGDWVEQGSGLNLSKRQAFYYISILRKSQRLSIDRDQMMAAGMSKLKEIFSLESETQSAVIQQLVLQAGSETLENIRSKVHDIKRASGRKTTMHDTLKYDREIKETVDRAFSLARLNNGDIVDENGIVREASDTRCLEMVCASYVQDVNNYPEGVSPASF